MLTDHLIAHCSLHTLPMNLLIEPQTGQQLKISWPPTIASYLLHVLAFLHQMCQLIRTLCQLTLELQFWSCPQVLHEYFSDNFLDILFLLSFFYFIWSFSVSKIQDFRILAEWPESIAALKILGNYYSLGWKWSFKMISHFKYSGKKKFHFLISCKEAVLPETC